MYFWCLILAGYFLNLLLPSVPILMEANAGVDIINQGLASQFSNNLDAIQGQQNYRIKIWLITLSLIGDAPIFGNGLGRFAETFYETIIFNSEFHSSPHFSASLSHPHNEILYLLAEHGVIGFLLIAVPLTYMATGMMKLSGSQSLYILALLLPIGLHTIVEFPLYISGLHWLLLGLIIVWGLNFEKASLTSQPFLPAIRPSIRLFLILGVISLPSFYAGQMALYFIKHGCIPMTPDIIISPDILNIANIGLNYGIQFSAGDTPPFTKWSLSLRLQIFAIKKLLRNYYPNLSPNGTILKHLAIG